MYNASNISFVEDEDGRRYAFHYRDLGVRVEDTYPGKKWSDVTINGVSLDKTFELEDIDDHLHIVNEGSIRRESKISDVNEKKVSNDIQYSGSNEDKVRKKYLRETTSTRRRRGRKELKRKRSLPPKRKKKYPTKPKKKRDGEISNRMVEKKKGEEDHFKWEINDAQKEIEEVSSEIEKEKERYAMKYNSDYIYPNTCDFINLEDSGNDDISGTEDTSESMIANL